MLILTCTFAEQRKKKQSNDLSESVKKPNRQSKYLNQNRRAMIDALRYTGAKVPILKYAKSQDKEAVISTGEETEQQKYIRLSKRAL